MMGEIEPANIQVNGTVHTFYPDSTVVRAARLEPVYNHVQIKDGNVERIFNHPKLCVYLGGIVLPGYPIDEEAIFTAQHMMKEFGWNAKLELDDYMDEYVKDRYISLATKSLSHASFPKKWLQPEQLDT